MSSSPEISNSNKMANLKPRKTIIPKVWKRPHSTIYGKNVEFGSKLYSDKIGEINGRKFNSELPWQVRNSGPGTTSGSSSSQGYISRLLNEPHSTLLGSVVTSAPILSSSSSSNYYATSSADPARDYHGQLVNRQRLTPTNCSNYAEVLELTNPNRYSKRRAASSEQDRRRRLQHEYECYKSSGLNANLSDEFYNNKLASNTRPTASRRIDFYDEYLDDFNNEIHRQNQSSRLLNDPLMQRRAFDKYLDFNYELGLFVPNYGESSTAATRAGAGAGRGEGAGPSGSGPWTTRAYDDGRSLMRKRSLENHHHWQQQHDQPHEPAQPSNVLSLRAQRTMMKHNDDDDRARPTRPPITTTTPYHHCPSNIEHHSDINCHQHFNPVITTTKQTQLLPRHSCQLADSPYGQSADGRKLSLGSINPHSYRPSLPNKTTTVHASDGEEFEFQDRSSPFYTDRWAGRTIRHFDSDLYSNASLFKSMIL